MEKTADFKKEDFKWTDKPVIGLALSLQGGSIDSHGNRIKGQNYYKVGKHKETGQVVIINTELTPEKA
jgi:hypothetical protein